jgi:hypothetical protein
MYSLHLAVLQIKNTQSPLTKCISSGRNMGMHMLSANASQVAVIQSEAPYDLDQISTY